MKESLDRELLSSVGRPARGELEEAIEAAGRDCCCHDCVIHLSAHVVRSCALLAICRKTNGRAGKPHKEPKAVSIRPPVHLPTCMESRDQQCQALMPRSIGPFHNAPMPRWPLASSIHVIGVGNSYCRPMRLLDRMSSDFTTTTNLVGNDNFTTKHRQKKIDGGLGCIIAPTPNHRGSPSFTSSFIF